MSNYHSFDKSNEDRLDLYLADAKTFRIEHNGPGGIYIEVQKHGKLYIIDLIVIDDNIKYTMRVEDLKPDVSPTHCEEIDTECPNCDNDATAVRYGNNSIAEGSCSKCSTDFDEDLPKEEND